LIGSTGVNCFAGQSVEKIEKNGKSQIVSKINIKIHNAGKKTDLFTHLARTMILLKQGEPFTSKKFQESINTLKSSHVFKKIEVPDVKNNTQDISLTFHLTPFLRIKAIKITGGFPLFEWEILNAMTFRAGSIFLKSKIDEQETAIKKIFQEQGFIAPEVKISVKEELQNHDIIIYVNISKGKFYSIKDVLFHGNKSISATRLKLKTNTWYASLLFGEGSRLVQEDLDEDIRHLTKLYREKGFADVVITSKIKKSQTNNDITVIFQIVEGPLYEINFKGNSEFCKFVQYIVDTVNIVGNKKIKTSMIKKQILTTPPGILNIGGFVPDVLTNDILAVKALYLKYGYMNAKIKKTLNWKEEKEGEKKEENKKFVDVTLSIDEGVCTYISSLTIDGLTEKEKDYVQKELQLQPSKVYQKSLLQNDENIILSMISEKGYPDIKVTSHVTISNNCRDAKIIYNVNKGHFTKMGDVFFTGNFRTKDSVLEKEMEIKTGDPFSLVKINASQNNIQSMNAIDSVKFDTIGLKENLDYVDLVIDIEEVKPFYVQASTGYNTEKLFYVSAGIGDHNFFGLNKELSALAEISQIGYRGDITLKQQRFFGWQIDSLFNVFIEKKEELNLDFGTKSYGSSIGFKKKLYPNLSSTLNFTFENKEQFQRDDKPIPVEDIDQYTQRNIIVLTPALIYDSTDSFARPKKGIRATCSTDISHGLDNKLDDFLKYYFETRYYYTPLKHLTFALRGRYTHIELYGGNVSIPDDQLIFLGGTSTVRGFSENRLKIDAKGDAVGGRTAILGNVEARYDLGFNLEVITFFDTGSIRDSETETGSDKFRSSVGLGIGYITPIGPLEVLYGWKLDKQEQESSGCFSFSIGYTF